MAFPKCPLAADGRRQNGGSIIRRVCLNRNLPSHKKQVIPSECETCQGIYKSHLKKTHDPKQNGKTDPSPKSPSLAKRIITYTQSVAEWVAAGRPERTDEDVRQIFQTFCEPCTWRKRKTDICRGCGCRVVDKGLAITNKIKMATQHCPREKW